MANIVNDNPISTARNASQIKGRQSWYSTKEGQEVKEKLEDIDKTIERADKEVKKIQNALEDASLKVTRIEKLSTRTQDLVFLGFLLMLITVFALVLSEINNFNSNVNDIRKEINDLQIKMALKDQN